MESKDTSAEIPGTHVVDGEIQLTTQTALAARIMHRELIRAAAARMIREGKVQQVRVGPTRRNHQCD